MSSSENTEVNHNRRILMKAIGVATVVGATASISTPVFAKPKKGEEKLSKEELEKAYAETEKKIRAGSTKDRPGLKPWQANTG